MLIHKTIILCPIQLYMFDPWTTCLAAVFHAKKLVSWKISNRFNILKNSYYPIILNQKSHSPLFLGILLVFCIVYLYLPLELDAFLQ